MNLIALILSAKAAATTPDDDFSRQLESNLLPDTHGHGLVHSLSRWAYDILDLFGLQHNPDLAIFLYSVIVLVIAIAIGLAFRWVLLSITRISGEQTAISKEYEAAEEILAASVHKFEKRFKSNIRIAVEVPQEVVLVPMDATLIQQVLLNLMENAVLHGESTTELRLSVEHIGDEACFTVSDNGLGIPRERLATLFDGSLSGEKSGGFDMKKNMGIGLSVCQTIVKAHGGRITAENRPEGGAQFRFYLPLKEEKEDEDQG